MVTVREGGKERRITAAEAFILQLTKKGLEGCGASARASLASIEAARHIRQDLGSELWPSGFIIRAFDIGCICEDFGFAVRINKQNADTVRLLLKPWIVEAALARMTPNQLTEDEQRVVLASTRTPQKVQWPDWWVIKD